MFGIVRAGRGFRMVLDGENGQRFDAACLRRSWSLRLTCVTSSFGRQAVGLHREAVIVRSDLDVAVAQILDRLIAAAMTEFQFVSLAAENLSEI